MKIHRTFFLLILGLGVPMASLTASENKTDIADASRDPLKFASGLRVFVLEHGEFWDVKKVADVLVKSNANAIRADVGIFRGNVTMYPSTFLPPHPGLGNRNQLQELITECKKHNIMVFPYNAFYNRMAPETIRLHPDWASIQRDGSTTDIACQNNPDYVAAYANACKELVENYEVAGMYFDGPGELSNTNLRNGLVKHDYCFCKHCQNVFQEKYGSAMPLDSTLQYDQVFRNRMLEVFIHGTESMTSEVVKAIKSVTNIPVLINMCDPVMRFIRHNAMNIADGGLVAEIGRSTTFMEALARLKVGKAFNKTAWCYCPVGPHEKLVTYDDLETALFGYMQLMHGGTPILETLQAFLYDTTGIAAVNNLFTYMQKNREYYVEYRPTDFLALLSSKQTGHYYSALDPKERSGHWDNDYFRGAFSALTHEHQQFNVILDQHLNISELKKYKALILPNSICLSDAQINAIKQFVYEGGGLIATHQTSLRNESGIQREDFALADLFKVGYQGMKQLDFKRLGDGDPYLCIKKLHPVTEGIPIHKMIFCEQIPFAMVSTLSNSNAIADMYIQDVGESFKPIYFPENAPSGILANEYGKGRVVYIVPPLDIVYFDREFRLIGLSKAHF